MSEKDITLKTVFVKPLSKGLNAVVIGTGEKEYFSKWKQSESAAEQEIQELVGQEGIEVRMQFTENGGYQNWTEYEILGERRPDFEQASEPAKDEGEPTSPPPANRQKATAIIDTEQERRTCEDFKLKERTALVSDVEYYLGVAKEAWINIIHPFNNTTTNTLDATDKEAIQKIAVHLRMNKRGR